MNEETGGGLFGWVCLTCIWVFIAAGVIDTSGRHEDHGEHPGSLPANVQQLSSDSYIVRDADQIKDVCWGSGRNVAQVETQSALTRIPGEPTYIECVEDQTWNVGGDKSPNLTDGFEEVATSPVAWGAAGISLLLCLIPGMNTSWRRHSHKRDQKREFKLTFDDKKDAITQLWIDGKIDQIEWEEKLGELVKRSK